VPTALLHNLKHNKVLHEHNVILTVGNHADPRASIRLSGCGMEAISDKFTKVEACAFGFMEQPNVPKALAIARKLGWAVRHHVDVVFSSPGARSKPSSQFRECRDGRITCSSGSAARPTTPPIISRFRPAGWLKSGPK